MKTLIDVIAEFSEINDAKIKARGVLDPPVEARWRRLKTYYDQLMLQTPNGKIPRALENDLRERVSHRARLRVPTKMDVFFQYQNDYPIARLVNLSRGGLFLGADLLLGRGARITLYLPNLGPGYDALFETRAEVVWATLGNPRAGQPRGMGVCFREITRSAEEQLDAFLVDALGRRIATAQALELAWSRAERRYAS